jgi:hypothetical protein
MRTIAIAVATLLVLAASPAGAAVPNSVTALLGPSVGYLLSQSDLCHWNLTERIRETYQHGFKEIGMTSAQQAVVWEEAKAHQMALAGVPAEAKARMKVETCTSAFRARVERDLAE